MKIKLLIYIFLVIGSLSVTAQNISGKILDKITNEPVIDAKITVSGTDISVFTDTKGNFTIKVQGSDLLEIEHPSYIKIKSEPRNSGIIYMVSSVINLEEIIIRSDPQNDITHSFVVIDNIKRGSQPRNSADLFNDIPGFSIQKRSAMASEPSLRSFRYEQNEYQIRWLYQDRECMSKQDGSYNFSHYTGGS